MHCWNVGIVGGGPGGLFTAYSLQGAANTPYRLTLFEASGRWGGKILTPQFSALSARYEAGAAEFYDYTPVDEDPLKDLVAELGLSINSLGGSAVIMNQQILTNLDDLQDHLGVEACESLRAFDRTAKDWMSPREYYSDVADGPVANQTDPPFDAVLGKLLPTEARRYLECLMHSDLATEPERTNVSYGLQNYLMNDPRYMRLYSIEGGNERLVEELARRISATKRLNHVVTDIHKNDCGQLTVKSLHLGEAREDSFDFVVLALPNHYLPNIQFGGARLSAAMKSHHAHYDHPAHYLRMTILFDRPFWRSAFHESFCMLDSFGGCCLYDETSREPGASYGILGWLVAGDAALEMSRLNDEALLDLALASIPESWTDGRRYFLEGAVHRWVNAVNAIPGGRTPRGINRRHQPEPVEHANLFVVGDYMLDSTLNGVLDSAESVAEWLADRMLTR